MKVETKTSAKKKGIVTIKTEWCKGCEICVEFCPKGVLGMDKTTAKVINPDDCIACLQCELLCPDFCIDVQLVEEGGKSS